MADTAAGPEIERARTADRVSRVLGPPAAFLAGVGPVAGLGFTDGGYPVVVVAGYGIVLWWLLVVGILTRALPLPRPSGAGVVLLAALSGLVLWGALSLAWSAHPERGLTEVVRLVVALGSVLLAMGVVTAGRARTLAAGVFAGLCAIVGAAVLTRLQPDLVPSAGATAAVLRGTVTRLAWPLNYWNAIAAAAAIAIPLGLVLCARARTPGAAAAAAAPLPVLALGIAFTLSRGGIVAAVLGVAAALVLVTPRLVVLRTLLAPAAGSAVLLLHALSSAPLTDVTGDVAQADDGRGILLLAVAVTVAVGVVQAGLTAADLSGRTPRLPRPSRRAAGGVLLGLVLAAGATAAVADLPGAASDRWDAFTAPRVTASRATENSVDRLSSISSNGRHAMWTGALDALEDRPLRGLGIGSWEGWWTPRRGDTGFVRNAHSEPFELLAETGLVGGLLFALVLGAPIVGGVVRRPRRGLGAAGPRGVLADDRVLAVPAFAAFVVAVAIDWNWQIGAVMVAGMALAAPSLSRPPDPERGATPPRHRVLRGVATAGRTGAVAGTAVAAVAAIATMAVALVPPQAVSSSRAAVARNDLRGAERAARRGAQAASFAESPALQHALVQEQAGDLAGAERSARQAASRAPEDWRPWFLVARIAAARGRYDVAVQAFRRARARNASSPLLRP